MREPKAPDYAIAASALRSLQALVVILRSFNNRFTRMKSETRDGMRIDWDAPIEMDDGVVLRADVFRPIVEDRHPVILSYGPYAKGLAFQEGFKSAWMRLTRAFPEAAQGSSNKYQNWELVDPEKWVPDGYAIVRVNSRGAGCSRAISRCGLRAKRRTFTTASNGRARGPGRTEGSESTAFPIMQ